MAGQYFLDPRPYYFITGEQKLVFVDDCFPPKKDPKFIENVLKEPGKADIKGDKPGVETSKDKKTPAAPTKTVEEKSKTIELRVDLCCEKCERKVDEALRDVQGVENVDCDQMNKKVTVKGKVKPEVVLTIVKKVRRNAQLVDEKKK